MPKLGILPTIAQVYLSFIKQFNSPSYNLMFSGIVISDKIKKNRSRSASGGHAINGKAIVMS